MAHDSQAMTEAQNGANGGSGFSLGSLRRAPVRTECGHLFTIPEGSRYPDLRGRRKLVGSIGKTTERADRRACSHAAKWSLALTDELELAVCEQHAKQLGPKLQARRAAQGERLAEQVDEPELVTDGGRDVSGPECGVCGHEHPEDYLAEHPPRCDSCGAYGEPSSRTVRTDGGQDVLRESAEAVEDGDGWTVLPPEVRVQGDVPAELVELVEAALEAEPNVLDAPLLRATPDENREAELVARFNELPVSSGAGVEDYDWLPPYRARERLEAELHERVPDGWSWELERAGVLGFYRDHKLVTDGGQDELPDVLVVEYRSGRGHYVLTSPSGLQSVADRWSLGARWLKLVNGSTVTARVPRDELAAGARSTMRRAKIHEPDQVLVLGRADADEPELVTDGGVDLPLFKVDVVHTAANTKSTEWVRAANKHEARRYVRSRLYAAVDPRGFHTYPAVERTEAPEGATVHVAD